MPECGAKRLKSKSIPTHRIHYGIYMFLLKAFGIYGRCSQTHVSQYLSKDTHYGQPRFAATLPSCSSNQ